jgi:tRNA-binding protein
MATWEDFKKIEMRVGEIVDVKDFPEARNPAYIVYVNFGEALGIKKSSAQITNYKKEDLIGRQVICVTNFPTKQIGPITSEILILGVPSGVSNSITLLSPDSKVPIGGLVY